MAKDAMLFDEIAGDQTNFQFENIVAIDCDGLCALCTVATNYFRRDSLAIGDDGVNDRAVNVLLDGAEMIAQGEMRGFSGLGHKIGNVNTRGFGASDSTRNFGDKKIGNDACI